MTATSTLPPRRRRSVVLPTVTLALWRVRQTWRLLLATGSGILAAVVLVCTIPLFSQVSLTAGLRGVLNATPNDSVLTLHATGVHLSTGTVSSTEQASGALFQQHLGAYLTGTPDLFIEMPYLIAPALGVGRELQLLGAPIQEAPAHVTLLKGRLPQPSSNDIEIAITPQTAYALNLSVGSTFPFDIDFDGLQAPLAARFSLHVVGIFSPIATDPFWHGQDFSEALLGHFAGYKALVSDDAFLAALTRLSTTYPANPLNFVSPPDLFWYYRLNVPYIRITELNTLIDQIQSVQAQIGKGGLDTEAITGAGLFGPAVGSPDNPSTLVRFRDRLSVVQIPIDILLLQILALVLFFISLMAGVLVDRQAEAIALLRSRGAGRRQIFGAFVTQALGLGIIALIAGPLLAIPAARFLAQHLLTSADQQALNILDDNPILVALSVGWFALAAAVSAMIALTLAVRGSASRDVLEMRREIARTTRRPLWQRLHLDLLTGGIALTSFALSLYISRTGVNDAQANLLIAAPLALVAPIFLVIAGILFFLRFFPLFLRMLAWLANHRPGASSMLALAQIARDPRQTLRMVSLLALTGSFAFFTLAFPASESQQILTTAAYQVGADFSGNLIESFMPPPPTLALTDAYRHLPGVMSASMGYVGDAFPPQEADATLPFAIRGVDADTFAQTAIWTAEDSTQSLASLMAQLVSARNPTSTSIPAIVDALTWDELQLSKGASFELIFGNAELTFTVIAEVKHIPTVNDSLVSGSTSDYIPPGGILVDYQTLSEAYKGGTTNPFPPLPPNYIWLRTSDNPALLAQLRTDLTSGPLQLATLQDRRAMIDDLQHDPLYLDLTGVLAVGAFSTLLLALGGSLIASWLSARNRLTNFALLRALGGTPRQIASVLLWEQGIVYTAAILLAILFGALLVGTIIPALVFTDAPNHGATLSSGEFYVMQHILPIQIVIPPTLAIVLVALVVLCALALWIMARVVSRPSISQTLRLNDD
jgi:putative ABC transport system permease protein